MPFTKRSITRSLIAYQLAAFGMLLFLIVGDEVFDFPHTVFGADATPLNWPETAIEAAYVLLLALFSIFVTTALVRKVRYLEGFISICMHCRKVRVGTQWQPLEQYIQSHSEASLSHGLCPECLEKHYPDVGPAGEQRL